MHPTFDSNPRQVFATELLLRAQPVRALLLDVDGVLTPGDLVVGADGEQVKRFCTLDGHGLKMLQGCGIAAVVLSGRDSAPLRARLDELGLTRHAVLGRTRKLPGAQSALDALGLDWGQVAAIGDDWPDLPLLARAQLAACPPGAHPEVRARAHLCTRAAAGAGAVRELCDLLLSAHGRYPEMLAQALAGD